MAASKDSNADRSGSLSTLGGWLLAVTAAAPMFAFYAGAGLVANHRDSVAWQAAAIFVGLVALCYFGLRALMSTHGNSGQSLYDARLKVRDSELLGISLAYLLPIATQGLGGLPLGMLICLVLLFTVLVVATHSYHVNPMLVLLGWRFYEVETSEQVSYTVLSRRNLRKPGCLKCCVELAPFVWLDRSTTHDVCCTE